MAENYTPTNVTTFTNDNTAVNTVNNNFAAISTAFSDTLSRSGNSPNQMQSNLDMNSNQILNLPSPATINSPARLIDVAANPSITVPPVGTSGATVPLLNAANTWSNTQTFNLPNTNSNSIFATSSLTGTTSQNPFSTVVFSCSDNLAGPGVNSTVDIYQGINGSAVNNARYALVTTQQLLQPTSNTNTKRFYVAGNFSSQALSGDGGILGAEQGSIYGVNPVVYAAPAASHLAGVIGTEIDVICSSGSTVLDKYGMIIALTSFGGNSDSVSGSRNDAGLVFTATSGVTNGWTNLIQIGDGFDPSPIKTTGSIMALKNSPTFANGINLSGAASITGNAFSSPGFSVTGVGVITSGSNGGTGGQLTLNGATSGSCQIAINSNSTSLFIQSPISSGSNGGLGGSLLLNGATSGASSLAAAATGGLIINSTPIQYQNAASFTANGAGAAVTIGAVTPAAITTPGTIFKWVTAIDSTGTTIYWPVWH